jgi:hypothetical protein
VTAIRKSSSALKPFLAGAFIALAARKLFAGRRRESQPTPDPFGPSTGRGIATTPPSNAALAEGYEISDANGRHIAITIAIFAGSAAFAIGGTILALHLFAGTPAEYGNFTQSQRHHVDPPAPRLQADPVAELARYQSQENAALTTYRKTAPGLARIPIARAMALMEGKPLDPTPMVQK